MMRVPFAMATDARRFIFVLAVCLAPVLASSALDDASLLVQKKQELEQRETELKAREDRLRELEQTLSAKVREYQDLKAKAEAYLKEIQVIQGDDLAHLIKTYENMPADAAARRIEVLDTPLAVKVLRGMKTRTVGKVMAQINPARAAVLSQLMVSR